MLLIHSLHFVIESFNTVLSGSASVLVRSLLILEMSGLKLLNERNSYQNPYTKVML